MKKLLLVSMVVLLIGFIWGCSVSNKQTENPEVKSLNANNMQKINLYFTDHENSKILSETREVIVEDSESLPRIAVQELLKGPTNLEMKRAIPEDTRLIDIKQEGMLVTVNFSKEYYKTGDIGEIVERFSIVNTLCDLPNVQKVKILVEGKELTSPKGEPFGFLDKDDVLITSPSSEEKKTKLTLYFSDSESQFLIEEKRQVAVKDNEKIEKHVIQELIKGPQDKGLLKTVPPETEVISIETKEGTCFVNLSQDFKLKHWGGSTGEIMTIYSIVNSLTELPHINKVQFLIEGKKVEVFQHMVFNEPFERNTRFIKE